MLETIRVKDFMNKDVVVSALHPSGEDNE